MKKFGMLFCLLLAVSPAFAQKPAPAVKPAAPAAVVPAPKPRPDVLPLSATERLAIAALAEKMQVSSKALNDLLDSVPRSVALKLQSNESERDSLLAQLRQAEAEIAAEHPGYHFNENTGTITKDTAPSPQK